MTKAQVRPSRRGFFMGASAVTAVAAVATVSQKLATSEPAAAAEQPTPERGGGYNVSEHVKRYYRTARV
jgi:nitrous oxide reductase